MGDLYENPDWRQRCSEGVKVSWGKYSEEEYQERCVAMREGMKENRRSFNGQNNPMAGRSAVKEKNLRWYTDGEKNLYVTEGTEPPGWWRGRTMKRRSSTTQEVNLRHGTI